MAERKAVEPKADPAPKLVWFNLRGAGVTHKAVAPWQPACGTRADGLVPTGEPVTCRRCNSYREGE